MATQTLKAQHKKGLQKLTLSEIKFEQLILKDKLTKSDLESFTDQDHLEWRAFVAKKMNLIKGDDLEIFVERIEDVMPAHLKSQYWEQNHIRITTGMAVYLKENGVVPTKTTLAEKTGISRQTIHKHLREFDKHPHYLEQISKYKAMATILMGNLFQNGMNGDVKASRLFLELSGFAGIAGQSDPPPVVNNNATQNNYLQINGTMVTQETLSHLLPDQLMQFENLVKSISTNNNSQS